MQDPSPALVVKLKSTASPADTDLVKTATTYSLSVVKVCDLDEATITTLRGLNRRQWGLMRRDFDRAINCDEGHPNERSFVIIARHAGRICGWTLVHATAMPYRERAYSRKWVYLHEQWLMYVYVAKSQRGQGLGRLLTERTCDEAHRRFMPRLRVRAWDRSSAELFARHSGRVWWTEDDDPAKWLPKTSRRAA